MKKRLLLAAMLTVCAVSLAACSSVEGALREVGAKLEAETVQTPANNGGDIDWSFVPVVRELAEKTFAEGFPEAEITNANVATVNGRDSRVIVVLSYTLNGKSGEYGFDYTKTEDGAYELKRYGEGVEVADLH